MYFNVIRKKRVHFTINKTQIVLINLHVHVYAKDNSNIHFTENIRHPTASNKNFFRFEPVTSN